jgi:CheY-like chemotaxis protein
LPHILLVEDNPVVRMLAEHHLESGGYTVMAAANGVEALQLASVVRPDLVLSDIDMPELDGLGLLRALRADPRLSAIPVIFLTMYDDMETFRLTREMGVDDYVNKPIQGPVLLESIRRCLAASRVG